MLAWLGIGKWVGVHRIDDLLTFLRVSSVSCPQSHLLQEVVYPIRIAMSEPRPSQRRPSVNAAEGLASDEDAAVLGMLFLASVHFNYGH